MIKIRVFAFHFSEHTSHANMNGILLIFPIMQQAIISNGFYSNVSTKNIHFICAAN